MAEKRETPYGAFAFLISLGNDQGSGEEGQVVGGFSDVSGLGMELSYSEYRNGNERQNTVRKVPNTYKVDDVTLKRGVIGSTDLYDWLAGVAAGDLDQRSVTITLLDEARNPVATWELTNASPKKWTGPTLAAKGGGEVAMEEISFVHEGLVYR